MHHVSMKGLWGLIAASQLWLLANLYYDYKFFLWGGIAHTSPHIHEFNTPLWIHSRLPTRRPSIALTLILHVLEYPFKLSMYHVMFSSSPYPRMRLFEQNKSPYRGILLHTCSHNLAPYARHAYRQPSSGSTGVGVGTTVNHTRP